MPSTIATMTSSVPIMSVPIASKTLLPVIAVRPTPNSAKTRPVSAAMSSRSTTGSSGAFAWRTNDTHDWPFARTWLLSLTAVRSESDSRTMAIDEHGERHPDVLELVRMGELLDALVDREETTDGEQDDRHDERVDVALAAVPERMLGVGLASRHPSAQQQQELVARVGERVDGLGEHRG